MNPKWYHLELNCLSSGTSWIQVGLLWLLATAQVGLLKTQVVSKWFNLEPKWSHLELKWFHFNASGTTLIPTLNFHLGNVTIPSVRSFFTGLLM